MSVRIPIAPYYCVFVICSFRLNDALFDNSGFRISLEEGQRLTMTDMRDFQVSGN